MVRPFPGFILLLLFSVVCDLYRTGVLADSSRLSLALDCGVLFAGLHVPTLLIIKAASIDVDAKVEEKLPT